MGRSRFTYGQPDTPHFLTATIVNWLPIFSDPDCAQILLDCWRYQTNEMGLRLHGYVVMENHIHWIASADDLPKLVHSFKTYTAGQIVRQLKAKGRFSVLDEMAFRKKAHKQDRRHQLWQEGVHLVMIQSADMMRQRLDYLHNNPVRRGYVDEARHWRYSSARDYCEEPGVIEIDRDWL